MITSVASALLTGLVLLAGFAIQDDQNPPPASKCVTYGCKAAYEGPLADGCAGNGLIELYWVNIPDTTIHHGSCHCPENSCVVQSNACKIDGMKIKIVATNPAHSLVVWGVNYGSSYTWSPKPISGCGSMKTEAITLVGVPGCVFAISILCRNCSFTC